MAAASKSRPSTASASSSQVFDTIGQLGLAITHARINTEKGAAIDSFCLTGPDGKKITDPALLRQLKTNLEEACLIPR